MNTYTLAPSLLAADCARLGEEAKAVLAAGGDIIHLDVMDNHYVPNLTFGPLICESLRRYGITAPIDVHLMVTPVDDLITGFAKAGATRISIHPEATLHLDRSLSMIRDLGCKAGLVLNPATPIDHLHHVAEKIDFVLLMSVNPGFGGQAFIPSVLDKARLTSEWIKQHQLPISLAIDGGIKIDNIAEVARTGVDTFVVGSAIFATKNYAETIQALRKALANK